MYTAGHLSHFVIVDNLIATLEIDKTGKRVYLVFSHITWIINYFFIKLKADSGF